MADKGTYLADIVAVLRAHWPENRRINIVCHGHSVPTGYFATPVVDTFNAYPHLLHRGLKQRFPFAVINVIVTGVGGEDSESGAARFEDEVLCHRPDIVTIDYGLNDRRIGLEAAYGAWNRMIESCREYGAKMILLTPTADKTQLPGRPAEDAAPLREHAEQIRRLAEAHDIGLADSLALFAAYARENDLTDLLSWINHPNRNGHEIVARALMRWFPAA